MARVLISDGTSQREVDLSDPVTIAGRSSDNKIHVDDSRLGRCKDMLNDIRKRLEVEAKYQELQGEFATDPIPVEKSKNPVDLTQDIRAYFNESK